MTLHALLLFMLQGAPAVDSPAVVVATATRAARAAAAEGVGAGWRRRLERDPRDRTALLGLATLARMRGDPEGAATRYERLLQRTDARDAWGRRAMLGMGQVALARSNLVAADSILTLVTGASAASGDSAIAAESYVLLAWVRSRTRTQAEARRLADSARLFVPRDSSRLAAAVSCRDAGIIGAGVQARARADSGLALARRAADVDVEGQCLTALGQIASRAEALPMAVAYFTRAESAFRRSRSRGGLATALQWHGSALQRQSRFTEARSLLLDAVRESHASGQLSSQAFAYMGLSGIAAMGADLRTATEYLARAESLLTRLRDRRGLASSRLALAGIARTSGDLEGARRSALDAERAFDAMGDSLNILHSLRLLATVAQLRGDWDEAERYLDRALAIARARGMAGWVWELPYHRAVVLMGRGRLVEAERIFAGFARELDTFSGVRRTPTARAISFEVRMRLAELHARRGDLARTEVEMAEATRHWQEFRATQRERDLRLATLQNARLFGSPGQGMGAILDAVVRGGKTAMAFRLSEERRARELVERHDAGARDFAAFPAIAAATVPEVQAVLGDSTALLAFEVARDAGAPSHVFVISRRGVDAIRLPGVESSGDDARRMRALVEQGTDPRALSRRIGDVLLAPALARLPASVSRLVVVADGFVHDLPLDMLRAGDDRPMVTRFAISMAPSATAFVALRRRPPAAGREMLALGDARFIASSSEEVDDPALLPPAFGFEGALARLPASAGEARAVARYSDRGEVRLGSEASEAFLKNRSLERVGILHLATHAVVDSRALPRSALALSPGDGEDGWMNAAELGTLRLSADLVVLSACRSAAGMTLLAEGVQGLTAPLLESGARSVVATRWPVGDRAAVPFMVRFYGAMAFGASVADALRIAKLDAIRRGESPALWASFTVVGDGMVHPPVRRPRSWFSLATRR